MADPANSLCPEDQLASLLESASESDERGLQQMDALIVRYPEDARLHFLKGSILAGQENYEAARASMRQAVDIAPAQEAWGPLHGLPKGSYVKYFVEGLCHLIRDEFVDAIAKLEDGIRRNDEIALMNRDIQLIIDEIRHKDLGAPSTSPDTSSAQLLLQQAAIKSTKH